ncbi:peptide synthase [Mycolicibacterium brumae]|uniref:Peptide synthase n=1 Tax=Mycolicibacterium brumae TaxID=85968 RepID=A0A2G5PGL3_9MYCO|nr:peptide synthase [Mycolicibacterium brumae]
MSRSQRNIYNGVLQDGDPRLYLIGRRYRFRPVGVAAVLSALKATIRANPIHLCVLEPNGDDYPALRRKLRAEDLVEVCADGAECAAAADLCAAWETGLAGAPLVRYIIRTSRDGAVCGLDAYCHHILLDGGGTGVVEEHLGRALAGDTDFASTAEGFSALQEAHRHEADRIDEALERLAAVTARELAADARADVVPAGQTPGHASRGVLTEVATVDGADYEALQALADEREVPLNVLVAAAAVAVDAGARSGTDILVVHAIDNRFGEAALDVASCLVNSIAQKVRFAPFDSVGDVVSGMDRGYVKALRRRWLREERYRRMYLAINRTTGVEALTLNFLAAPCAPALRPHLTEPPATTDIGPIESLTVAAVVDDVERRLQITIWNREDAPATTHRGVGERIAGALGSFATGWERPVAATVGQWQVLTDGGTLADGEQAAPAPGTAPAWFADPMRPAALDLSRLRPWLAWLEAAQTAPGEVLVLTDDNTDRTVDLLLACHLAGCAYSPCDTAEQAAARARRIAESGFAARVVHPAAVSLRLDVDDATAGRVAARLAAVAADPELSRRTAYVMPTSGSTGEPKLVRISHGALAGFCDGIGAAYGWGPSDTVLQCAPLTSDISVEEIFGAVSAGARLRRSTATRSGDLQALCRDLLSTRATVADLPTALWHLLCDDPDAIASLGGTALRQLVIGGEPVRSSAVDNWCKSPATAAISLISTYGPTETTVIASYLPLPPGHDPGVRSRLGRPLVANTVHIAFGEVVIIGELVAAGYLGADAEAFGAVVAADGTRWRAYATGDRVAVADGHPVFRGRRDALVKISGRRIDTADISRRIGADTEITDLAVEVADGALGVWFSTHRSRAEGADPATAARVRAVLAAAGVPSYFVAGIAAIPRKLGGKVDRTALPEPTGGSAAGDGEAERLAGALADLWGAALGRPIGVGSSLLDEGVGSLDLIKILPPTRQLLGWQLSIFDLISADTAANLAEATPNNATTMPQETVAEVDADMRAVERRRALPRVAAEPALTRSDTIVVLGASGTLGRGFAEAVLDARRSGATHPEVVLAMRSALPDGDPWSALASAPGVRLERMPQGFGPAQIDALLRDTGAAALVNCIGSADMLAPYADLRPANLDIVPITIDACLRRSVSLVHLSTSVLVDDVCAARVVDPRQAPYPYAAVKAVAELAMADAPEDLDFTMVRLPRVLGEPAQLAESNDILVSIVDACAALGARPLLSAREEVTTGRAAAQAILSRLADGDTLPRLGRDITALRGTVVDYREFLAGFADRAMDAAEWKHRLDTSSWARRHPQRWSIIDGWLSLGALLGGRTYAEFLAQRPAVELDIRSVTELQAPPGPLRELLGTVAPQNSGTFPS